MSQSLFITLADTVAALRRARVLVESIRTFGGELAGSPVWVFTTEAAADPLADPGAPGASIVPMVVPEPTRGYLFAAKVEAGALAEERAPREIDSLAWIDPECLVVGAPTLLDLEPGWDAAVRPVHVRNVGSPAADPPDAYWSGVYRATGVGETGTPPGSEVESFVDRQRLRAYYNTHAFAVSRSRGLLGRWRECFQALVRDRSFQDRTCGDALHRVFLHQAVFSAILGGSIPPARLRILPPQYNYPYNLHASVPIERRARALNDVVTLVTEERSLDPNAITDVEVREPLRSWLAERKHLWA